MYKLKIARRLFFIACSIVCSFSASGVVLYYMIAMRCVYLLIVLDLEWFSHVYLEARENQIYELVT